MSFTTAQQITQNDYTAENPFDNIVELAGTEYYIPRMATILTDDYGTKYVRFGEETHKMMRWNGYLNKNDQAHMTHILLYPVDMCGSPLSMCFRWDDASNLLTYSFYHPVICGKTRRNGHEFKRCGLALDFNIKCVA
jgi:hypothetical protein